MAKRELTDYAIRAVVGLVSFIVLLLGWISTRELGRIAASTAMTERRMEVLNETVLGMHTTQIQNNMRLQRLEEERPCTDK